MNELRGYVDEKGNKPFAIWLETLDATAAAKVTIALTRIEQGNFSKTKGVGAGVFEHKIDFGPGYRIYFGKDGESIVMLVGGGAHYLIQGNGKASEPRHTGGTSALG
jgi:putative addiction module killer protein